MPINKWRKVDCTDDGCSLCQCLKCYNQWESRTAPGGWTAMETCDERDTRKIVSVGKTHFRDCEPIYVPNWTFCPHCGTKWDGSVRCDIGNERMLGERRLRIHHAIWRRSPPPTPKTPCWVIQQMVVDADQRVIFDWKDHMVLTWCRDCLEAMRELKRTREHEIEQARNYGTDGGVKWLYRLVRRKS